MVLEHPLPPGMRDLLPEEAQSRRSLARVVLERFALHGYRVVTPPAFEFEDVLERGLGDLAAADVLRFIEPESGEVAVLRPDMTPQIARIVATRMRHHTPPFRLAYEGTVVRRRLGRAKKHRQIPQVGVELCGLGGQEGDVELLALAADVLRAAGLSRFTIDVSDAGVVRELVADLPSDRAAEVTRALAAKDDAMLAEVTRGIDVGPKIVALAHLYGGREAVVEATRLLAGTRAEAPAQRLLALFDAASARGLGPVLRADPGEVRGFAYYTGTIWTLFAAGPGEAIGAGGRYDDLLSRFGMPMPAVGFGLDLDALALALRSAGARVTAPSGIVVVGAPEDPRIPALRARGIAAVSVADPAHARAYAASWAFAGVWDGASLVSVATGESTELEGSLEEAADAAARVLRA